MQLATSQEAGGCQGYSSTIEQVSGVISPNSNEQVTLTVNVTEDSSDQTADDCETTVTATASPAEPGTPGAPAQADVSTFVEEGSS